MLLKQINQAATLLWLLVPGMGAAGAQDRETPGADADQRPDILLIVSEDNGPHLSCYGDRNVQTPVLDCLAGDGIRFTNAYVTQAGCSPSRSSLLTGLYPHQNGQLGLATHRYAMYRHWPNLPGLLKKRGYRTGIIGKLHVNPEAAFPFDFNCNDQAVKGRDVDSIARIAGRFIKESEEPFFLMVNYPDAHVPFLTRVKGIPREPLRPGEAAVFPEVGIQTRRALDSVADYYNSIKRLDTGIGLLLEQLKQSGRSGNTLIVYLADHGPQLARGKMTSYEFGIKVPLIIRWPAMTGEEQVADELVSAVDLMPTLLQAAGAEVPAGLPGQSLLPLIRGEVSGKTWRKYLFTEYTVHYPHVYFPQRTVRDERYKLILNCLRDRPNPLMERYIFFGRDITRKAILEAPDEVQQAYATFERPPALELYDLQEDPYEYHNLAADPAYAGVLKILREKLEQWQRQTADPLADPEKLRLLTAEHDSLTQNNTAEIWVARNQNYIWRYAKYLNGQ